MTCCGCHQQPLASLAINGTCVQVPTRHHWDHDGVPHVRPERLYRSLLHGESGLLFLGDVGNGYRAGTAASLVVTFLAKWCAKSLAEWVNITPISIIIGFMVNILRSYVQWFVNKLNRINYIFTMIICKYTNSNKYVVNITLVQWSVNQHNCGGIDL